MKKLKFVLLAVIIMVNIPLFAQESVLTELNDFIPEELKYAGFKIDTQQEIKIEVAGMEPDLLYRDATMSHAWILNSDTRELVWHLQKADESDNKGDLTTFEDAVNLEPGTYEVYYSTFLYDSDPNPSFWGSRHYRWKYDRRGFFSKLFSEIFDDDEDYERERLDWDLFDEFYIKMQAERRGTFIEASAISYRAEVARRLGNWENAAIRLEELFRRFPDKEIGIRGLNNAIEIYRDKLDNPAKADSLQSIIQSGT